MFWHSSALTDRKRALWEAAAQINPYYYIASTQTQWDVREFFARGEREARELAEPFFGRMGFEPRDKRMIDIGCGVGRMTRAFSFMFAEAYGVDLSESMIAVGRELNTDRPNLSLTVNDGATLRTYPDDYFDFVFSFVTFQHIPSISIVASYLREIARVLKRGGLFKFQSNGSERSRALGIPIHYGLKNALVEISTMGAISRVLQKHPRLLGRFVFAGVSLPGRKLKLLLDESGLGKDIRFEGLGTRCMWCEGVKS